MSVELSLNLQERGIQILCAVTQRVERGHEYHSVQEEHPMSSNERTQRRSRPCSHPVPHWRFFHITADKQYEESREYADNEHSSPADVIEEETVDDRRKQKS